MGKPFTNGKGRGYNAQNLLKKNGIDFEHFAFTPKEEILIEYGQAIAEDPKHVPEKLFEKLYQEDTYEKVLLEYLNSSDYSELGYEHLLVYFVYRYLMNAVYDFDILSYAKMIVVATLVVRDMDAARYQRNGGRFTMFDRIDVARIFSKEVEHSEGNAEELKEMCMMEEIARVDALCRQI